MAQEIGACPGTGGLPVRALALSILVGPHLCQSVPGQPWLQCSSPLCEFLPICSPGVWLRPLLHCRHGLRILPYLENWLVRTLTQEQANNDTSILLLDLLDQVSE